MRADIPGKGRVEFEGRILPEGAKHFERIAFYKELPSDVKEWVLDLRYCWARERSAPSAFVLRCCDELESRIYKGRAEVAARLLELQPESDAATLIQEWLTVIMMIRERAERCEVSAWTMHPQPGEVKHFLGVAVGIARTMISTQNAQRPSNDQISVPPVFDVIGSAPEETQIRFINDVADSLTDPRDESEGGKR